ncbi:MAG: NAD(P)-dependent oxidoreductase, partial [Rhizobiales bacterium]|nr:NAD(P)-dependent oxidoreductase [Hyphomicrobiales bacterium]
MSNARKPIESKPARMGALARLPVFLALEGKRVVLVGFGPAAEWKRELLEA